MSSDQEGKPGFSPVEQGEGCDVLVVGGGAAGLSAALVLTRARRRVVVVDSGNPRNGPAAHMQGFLGSDGLAPTQLLATGRREVLGYGGQLVAGDVVGVEAREDRTELRVTTRGRHFLATFGDGSTTRARRLLVATGLRDELPDVPGVRERWGRDVLHCPYCHGFEVRDQPLGVLGGGPESVTQALLIRQWSADLIYFTQGLVLESDERDRLVASSIRVVEDPVAQVVVEDDRLVGVGLVSRAFVPLSAVFVKPRLVATDGLLLALGCGVSDSGWVVVDVTGRTTVPGVWAAGNCVNPRAQVITAAGEGSAAAIDINADLVTEDVESAVRNHRSGANAS